MSVGWLAGGSAASGREQDPPLSPMIVIILLCTVAPAAFFCLLSLDRCRGSESYYLSLFVNFHSFWWVVLLLPRCLPMLADYFINHLRRFGGCSVAPRQEAEVATHVRGYNTSEDLPRSYKSPAGGNVCLPVYSRRNDR